MKSPQVEFCGDLPATTTRLHPAQVCLTILVTSCYSILQSSFLPVVAGFVRIRVVVFMLYRTRVLTNSAAGIQKPL